MSQDLIDQLNTYRLEHKLSQPQLAKKLGVTFQTVNRWLNRHMKPGHIHEYHIKKLVRFDNSRSRKSTGIAP
jgi:transcriptional regulator with XRE-family HTH domain